MLKHEATVINKTLLDSKGPSIDIISIKANSAKDLLLIGNYFHIFISQAVFPSISEVLALAVALAVEWQ